MEAYLENFNKWAAAESPTLTKMADAVGVRPAVIAGIGLTLMLMPFLLFGLGTSLLILVFGVGFPAFDSHKALMKRDMQAIEYLMRYWICYAAFMFLETVIESFIWFFPAWPLVRVGSILWLWRFNGANIMYPQLVPSLTKLAPLVDQASETIGGSLAGVNKMGVSKVNESED